MLEVLGSLWNFKIKSSEGFSSSEDATWIKKWKSIKIRKSGVKLSTSSDRKFTTLFSGKVNFVSVQLENGRHWFESRPSFEQRHYIKWPSFWRGSQVTRSHSTRIFMWMSVNPDFRSVVRVILFSWSSRRDFIWTLCLKSSPYKTSLNSASSSLNRWGIPFLASLISP